MSGHVSKVYFIYLKAAFDWKCMSSSILSHNSGLIGFFFLCLWRSIVVRPPVPAGEVSPSCSGLIAGRVTTLWVKRPLSVNQHGQLSQPSLWGWSNE